MTPSRQHHQHNTIINTPSTQHHQHYTIYTTSSKRTSSTRHHQDNIINTTPSTQHHQHIIINTTQHNTTLSTQRSAEVRHRLNPVDTGCVCVAGAALGAPQSHFAWQAQHLEHLSLIFRGKCSKWSNSRDVRGSPATIE